MEKYSQIIILSNDFNDNEYGLIINKPVILEDDVHLLCEGEIYSFDYLIFTDVTLITNFKTCNILAEDNIPITNCLYQTTFENIYYPLNSDVYTAIKNIQENN